MCHECEDNGFDDEPFDLNMVPEAEREDFLDFACLQVSKVINKAEKEGFLYELITEWPKEKQLAFAVATVIQDRLESSWREEGE
jgi:hypothetical protein